jgi:hypothetical protein
MRRVYHHRRAWWVLGHLHLLRHVLRLLVLLRVPSRLRCVRIMRRVIWLVIVHIWLLVDGRLRRGGVGVVVSAWMAVVRDGRVDMLLAGRATLHVVHLERAGSSSA